MALAHLVLAAALAVGGESPPTTATQPPPGSKEDQALWMAGYETQTGALLEQDRARRAMLQLGNGRYYDRLAAVGRKSPEARPATEAQTRRLATAAADVQRAGTQPPFDLRTGCRYQLLGLGNALAAARGPNGAQNLATARGELSRCRDTVERWRAPLVRANDVLEQALADADALLARHEPARVTGTTATSDAAGRER